MDHSSLKFLPLRLLIVEDNPLDQRMLESMIYEQSTGKNQVEIAQTLKEALDFLSKKEFDVVILDLNLPDSKGEDTLITLSQKCPQVAIIVNTGVYEDDMGLRTLSTGAQDFLVKGKYNAYWLNKILYYAIERKHFELELKNAYDQLKETQHHLIQAEKMKVIGSLASGIAHEVKNPLATILYGTTYISKYVQIDDKKYQLALENIKEATLRANEIISELLDFASINKISKKPNNIHNTIDKSIQILRHQLQHHHVQIIKNYKDDFPIINLDSNRIEQVLVNLLLNACYAMLQGGQITITTHHLVADQDFLEEECLDPAHYKIDQEFAIVDIDDEGEGIDRDKINFVFDPFYTTRRGSGGVGLGLFVCRNIMEMHDSKIIVSNRKDKGVRVRLIFKAG